ncbi:hypothetical protein IE81DRAFT_201085 [Ceraceosorus guamensis]|uniref:Uncharacterized protein n=1 Tax=Ceraceosorus guamensis TaxID=1522189 RepID=A0A316VZH9_9BASI|nr:hypothetical protein IE81DRAFT_201085 [Ceraceosorus guamensis]PWN40895.1 hypothetical protein IE81DRAFT_201085 [Ceraceosorus guamensis]
MARIHPLGTAHPYRLCMSKHRRPTDEKPCLSRTTSLPSPQRNSPGRNSELSATRLSVKLRRYSRPWCRLARSKVHQELSAHSAVSLKPTHSHHFALRINFNKSISIINMSEPRRKAKLDLDKSSRAQERTPASESRAAKHRHETAREKARQGQAVRSGSPSLNRSAARALSRSFESSTPRLGSDEDRYSPQTLSEPVYQGSYARSPLPLSGSEEKLADQDEVNSWPSESEDAEATEVAVTSGRVLVSPSHPCETLRYCRHLTPSRGFAFRNSTMSSSIERRNAVLGVQVRVAMSSIPPSRAQLGLAISSTKERRRDGWRKFDCV